MSRRPSLRDRKKEQTRVELIRAAVHLFAEQGYEATTVDDIVETANYSRSTFFRYFGGKEDVVFGDLPERLDSWLTALRTAEPDGDPWGVVRHAMSQAIEITSLAPELEGACVALWFSEPGLRRRYTEMVLQLEEVVAEFFATAWGVDADSDMECHVLATAVVGVARAAITCSQVGDNTDVLGALGRGFDLLERGVARLQVASRRGGKAHERARGVRRAVAGH